MSTNALPLRKDVPVNETWDMSLLFPTQEAFIEALEQMYKKVDAFAKEYKGKLTSSSLLTNALRDLNVIDAELSPLIHYGTLPITVDAGDEQAAINESKIYELFETVGAKLAFVDLEIGQIDPSIVAESLESYPEAKPFIAKIMRFKDHQLDQTSESLLASLHSNLFSFSQSYDATKFQDLTFESFEVDGVVYPNSYVLFENEYEFHANTDIRHKAWESFHKTLAKYQHGTANNYINQVKLEKKIATLRGFDSVIDYLLSDQQVTREAFDRQLDVIMSEFAPVMRRYGKLIQEKYALPTLSIKDVKLSLSDDQKKISIEDAKTMLTDAFQLLGDDYVAMINRAFDDRWIDFPKNTGKSTGGFCASVYDGPSYILLSWTNLMSEVLVLAHELGHAGHFQNAYKHNDAIVPEASLYFIEAPSTCNEVVMCQYLLSKTDDKAVQKGLISEFISRTYFHNMVTHLLEAYFQREVYTRVDQKEHLNAAKLNQIFKETLEKFWGPEVEISSGAELTWMRQPHYYMGLYSYTYSAGLTIGTQVGLKLLKDPDKYAKAWLEILSKNGSLDPISLAKGVDVDMTNDLALKSTIAYVNSLIDQLES